MAQNHRIMHNNHVEELTVDVVCLNSVTENSYAHMLTSVDATSRYLATKNNRNPVLQSLDAIFFAQQHKTLMLMR